jgi:hypothetical protein
MVFIRVVVLKVVERMAIPDPWFDHHTLIISGDGLEEFLDPWRNLSVDQVIEEPKMVLVIR